MKPIEIAYLGLGSMGQPQARRLLQAGFAVTVWNRSADKAHALVEEGATSAATPAEAAVGRDAIFLNLADDPAVEAVVFGADGVATAVKAGAVVVDMGTTSPALTRDAARRLADLGAEWVDAPVSGGVIGATQGTLSIMAGGTATAFERVRPLFEILGKNLVHIGPVGAGQVAKACNQIVVSATLMGVAEALLFARREGVDPARVRQALLGGFAYSRILEVHGQRMLDENFEPGFKARLHRKDLGLVLDEARHLGMGLPATALAAQLMNALVGNGEGERDSSALIHMLERLSGGVA